MSEPVYPTYHVVPHFHYDVAFLDDFEGYMVPSFRAIEEALRLMTLHEDFTFVIEQISSWRSSGIVARSIGTPFAGSPRRAGWRSRVECT